MIHLDYETTSACDIRLGAYRYACDPTTRILMFAVAREGQEPVLWDFLEGGEDALKTLRESGDPIFSHNAQFEHAISRYRLKHDTGLPAPDIDRWRCTAAMCRRAAAPASLAEAAKFFKLGDLKDPVGKALIGIFSDQGKKVLLRSPDGGSRKSASPILEDSIPWDWTMTVAGEQLSVRDAWEKFKEYCLQDVRVEMELHKKLKHFELKGRILESFQFDFRMNDRGVPVNLDALRNADKLVDTLTDKLVQAVTDKCGIAPSRRDAILAWLRERGYPEDNLRAGTVDAVLAAPPEGMTAEAVEVLRLRSLVGFAALKKIPTMIASACPDGYVRGTTQWHAARTGRAGGRIIQPQNFRKTTIGEDTHLCYRMVREDWEPVWFEDLWPSPLEALASSIRHFIQPHEGQFYDADYSSVENKLAAWIVGEEEELRMIDEGEDMYKHMAVKLFNVPYDKVTKDQRTIAKPVVLGAGYGASGKSVQHAMRTMFKVHKTRKECNEYVRIYRESHEATVRGWRDLESAAMDAVRHPGESFSALSGRVSFKAGAVAGVNYLTFQLPSGRRIYYPWPKIEMVRRPYDEEDMAEDPRKAKEKYWEIEQVTYYGTVPGKTTWGRRGVYGSKWLENLCQAMGVDLLDHGCLEAEKNGFDIRMIVHDQILALDNGRPTEELLQSFCAVPKWAATFPQKASGDLAPYYTKD